MNRAYINPEQLNVQLLDRGNAWFDTGTQRSLPTASDFVKTIEERQELKICCPEGVAYHMDYISADQFEQIAVPLKNGGHGNYVLDIIRESEY